jgi:hypothetical protein
MKYLLLYIVYFLLLLLENTIGIKQKYHVKYCDVDTLLNATNIIVCINKHNDRSLRAKCNDIAIININ